MPKFRSPGKLVQKFRFETSCNGDFRRVGVWAYRRVGVGLVVAGGT
jgi:hypothetical protein